MRAVRRASLLMVTLPVEEFAGGGGVPGGCDGNRRPAAEREPVRERPQPEERQTGGQQIAADGDPEDPFPRSPGLEDPGRTYAREDRCRPLCRVLDAVVRRGVPGTEDVADSGGEERIDLAPGEEHQAR